MDINRELIRRRLDEIVSFLSEYLPFVNCHMVDYFTGRLWEKYIPPNVRQEVDGESEDGEIFDVFFNNDSKTTWKYPKTIELIKCIDKYNLKSLGLTQHAENDENSKTTRVKPEFLSKKKLHEVLKMSRVIVDVSARLKIQHLIDLGDGKGYLSSFLATYHKMHTLGIDASIINTESAKARALKFFTKYLKFDLDKPPGTYEQITAYVTDDFDLEHVTQKYFGDSNVEIGLIGLHTCGNLASDLIRLFEMNRNIRFMCSVGCCYNHLTEKFEENTMEIESTKMSVKSTENVKNIAGFPMSHHLIEKRFTLGRNARMLAAQSLDRIRYQKDLPHRSLFFRALFQVYLKKIHIKNISEIQIGRKASKSETFVEYVEFIHGENDFLKGSNVNYPIVYELIQDYGRFEKQLRVFYLLRAQFSIVIESLILADRLLYAKERFGEAFLLQLFDSVVSPRCYALVAIK